MANTNLKIYLTHDQLILKNNQGFRFEFDIPIEGNYVAIEIDNETFHISLIPPEAPSSPSPNVSPYEPEDSSSLSTPSDNDGGPGNGNPN